MEQKRILLYLLLYLTLDVISFSLILPWLPSILKYHRLDQANLCSFITSLLQKWSWAFNSIENNSWDEAFIGGVLSSGFSLAQFIASPLAGAASDKFGRSVVLFCLLSLSILTNLLWSMFGSSFAILILVRILAGIVRSNVAVLTALVGDSSSVHVRTRGMAIVGMAYSIGFTIGPPLSAFMMPRLLPNGDLKHLSFVLGLTGAILNLLSLPFLILLFQVRCGSDPLAKSYPDSLKHAWALMNPKKLFCLDGLSKDLPSDNKLRYFSLIGFIHLTIFSGVECSIPFLAQSRFQYTSKDHGKMFGFLGILMILTQIFFIRRFRLGNETQIITISMVVLATAFVVLGSANELWLFHIGLVFFAFAAASFVPTMHGLISLNARTDTQGQALGIFRSLNALARVIGPLMVSVFLHVIGPFVCFSLFGLVLLLLSLSFYQKCQHHTHQTKNKSN